MKRFRSSLLFAALALGVAIPARATPVLNPSNGHYYEVVASGEIVWLTAYNAATASSYLGAPGYLATVNSASEQSFVEGLLPGGFQYWIGGYQAAAGGEPGGNWNWDTSEPWGGYTHWDGGQPDNNGVGSPGDEDFLAMFSSAPGHASGMWNDEDNPGCPWHGEIAGYIVEYGGLTGVLAQPLGGCAYTPPPPPPPSLPVLPTWGSLGLVVLLGAWGARAMARARQNRAS